MVQYEVLDRIYRIKVRNNKGTTFTMENNGKQYLVTAKHLFAEEGMPNSSTIELLIGKEYVPLNVQIRYSTNSEIDIAVMKLDEEILLSGEYEMKYTTEGLVMGQDVYFVGFPYEYDKILSSFPGGLKPVPLIKKACVSAFLDDELRTILLDGINNPGFSGSPVCFKKLDRLKRL